ncbi:MAG TPA: DUF4190 domain-containing protein [Blastocatellia bacterium]|nr:DUF4190 domain-containing protein [Blastocatellia bacterium]
MSSLKKTCHECGMPLPVGIANCSHCGAAVGTLFDESSPPTIDAKSKHRHKIVRYDSKYDRIDKAKAWANNSVILGLASFFCPGIGFLMGVAALVLAVLAVRILRAEEVEEGRGPAIAGLIIGVLGLIAQAAYALYVLKSGRLPFIG